MPLVIGVTGSIAAGKSLVCRTLVELGAEHCNADTLVHGLYAPGTPGFDRVVAEFGEDVVAPDGTIDRRTLGGKVFGKPEAMRRLTRAMGDITGTIKAEIDRWRASLPENGCGVMEAVNLIEPGYAAWCDVTWLVVCRIDTAKARLMARDGFDAAQAEQRLASQRPWEQRAGAADLILRNDNGREALVDAVRYAYHRLWELRRDDSLPRSHYHLWRAANPLPSPAGAAAG